MTIDSFKSHVILFWQLNSVQISGALAFFFKISENDGSKEEELSEVGGSWWKGKGRIGWLVDMLNSSQIVDQARPINI